MEKLTEHFTWEEAACRDENRTPVPENLKPNAIKIANNVEIIRFALGGIPIHVNSFYRTEEYNQSIGGAPASQHLIARAMDIWATGIDPFTMFVLIEALMRLHKIDEGGIGLYNTFTHVDCRGYKVTWDLRTAK